MTNKDLKRIDDLVAATDMAVRVASQLRLWIKRGKISDSTAIQDGVKFLGIAVSGGKFVEGGEMVAGATSLHPFSWSADIHFLSSGATESKSKPEVAYKELVQRLDRLRTILESLLSGDRQPREEEVLKAAVFFDSLGRMLGSKADASLRFPSIDSKPTIECILYQ